MDGEWSFLTIQEVVAMADVEVAVGAIGMVVVPTSNATSVVSLVTLLVNAVCALVQED